MSLTPNVGRPTPWLQLSFVLARNIVEKNIHVSYLTISESSLLESAVETFAKWLAFFTSQSTDRLSKRDIAAFRVRCLLHEQLVPHLFPSKKLCCQSIVDLEQLCDEARSLAIPDDADVEAESRKVLQSPDPITMDVSQSLSPAPDDANTQVNKETLPISEDIEAANIERIPLYDVYHTLENDKNAMIEQIRLQEYEAREALNEQREKINAENHSLSMLNTGGNFNIKYLLQGIASSRDKTSLTDRELHNLLSDFKPHRSKWASDEKIGQEELYEALEKVLTDLKNYTEHSTPFLAKVNKKDAHDYFDVIKRPMDLGTMTKKMKQFEYKAKKEFADDLYLIYENCLLYNSDPASEYRKHAIAMRRKTDRLLQRVPDIAVKDRSEVEKEDEGDDLSEDDPEERVSRKQLSSSHKHPVKSQRPEMPIEGATRSSRERSLTRGSSAAPLSANDPSGYGSDSDTNRMTPDMFEHSSYGGKQCTRSSGTNDAIDLEQEAKDVNDAIDADVDGIHGQLWCSMTKKTRAELAADVERQYRYTFGDRQAIVRSPLDMGRFSMFEHAHAKPEATQQLIRCTPQRFSHWAERHRGATVSLYEEFDLDESDNDNLDAFFSRRMTKSTKPEGNDASRTDLFLPEYLIACGIPEIMGVPEEPIIGTYPVVSESEAEAMLQSYTDTSLDVYSSVSFPNHGLNDIIDHNVQKIQQIRKMHAKCTAVRNNVAIAALASSISMDSLAPTESHEASATLDSDTTPPMYFDHFSSSTRDRLFSARPSSDSKTPPPLILRQDSSQMILKGTISKLLAHAGFEGAQSWALSVFTEVVLDYMENLGKSLRCYWDDYGQKMSGEEIVLHTLYENGVESVSELDAYIIEDVERYGGRLDDVCRRLQSSYEELISGPPDKPASDEADLQGEESFITGMFGEDLGEDYFGFKNLGLDKEYDLQALSIPKRLWFGKDKEKETSSTIAANEPEYTYLPPPPFTPLASERELIGLLQPIFAKKLAEAPEGLIEDEYISSRHRNRPKYPPTNKGAGGGRKKAGKDGHGGAGLMDYKKKRKRPLEEIKAEKAERAEKRRQKVEERAQKLAEKEQKRKMRDELKEQERTARLEAKEKKALQSGPKS